MIAGLANIERAGSLTRIGTLINLHYREFTAQGYTAVARRVTVTGTASVSSQYITVSGIEKIERLLDLSAGTNRLIPEVSVEELRALTPDTNDTPTMWAVFSQAAGAVTIIVDNYAQTAYELSADGLDVADVLSGSTEPALPASFHDLLVYAVLADETLKKDYAPQAQLYERKYQSRLSQLKLFLATSATQSRRQNQSGAGRSFGSGTGSSGGSGLAAQTVATLLTFDRDPGAPFAVTASSAVVPNLDADKVDGLEAAEFVQRDGSVPLTANWDAGAFKVTANQLESDVATGTAPLVVASTTVVANLNASQLEGNAAAAFALTTRALDTFGAPTDITTLNASASAHGLLPKLSNVATEFLNGQGAFSVPAIRVNGSRLSLTTAVPVTSADVAAATTLYWTPYQHNQCMVYTGSVWALVAPGELSIAVPATTATAYDVFLDYNAGTPQLVLVAWTNLTTRATALTRQDGVLVLTGFLDHLYVGSFRTTGVSGQTEDSATKRYLWNAYNRVTTHLIRSDDTDSWTYTTDTFRQSNGSTSNQVEIFQGLAEEAINLSFTQGAYNSASAVGARCAIGEDSTTTPLAAAVAGYIYTTGGSATVIQSATALLAKVPAVGHHYYAMLERSPASGTMVWIGDNGGTGVNAQGITGTWRR